MVRGLDQIACPSPNLDQMFLVQQDQMHSCSLQLWSQNGSSSPPTANNYLLWAIPEPSSLFFPVCNCRGCFPRRWEGGNLSKSFSVQMHCLAARCHCINLDVLRYRFHEITKICNASSRRSYPPLFLLSHHLTKFCLNKLCHANFVYC